MPVIDENEKEVNGSASTIGAAMGTMGQQQQQPQQQRRGFSFSAIGDIARAPMGRNPQSEILAKLSKALEESYASMDKSFTATVLPIDRNNSINLTFSVIVVALQETAAKGKVAFHTLIIEGSSEPLAPRPASINGRTIEIMKVASDAYDNRLMAEVQEVLRRTFPKAEFYNADGCVVPASFSVDDHNLVYSLAANAATACFTDLTIRAPGFTDLNLANANNDSTLNVRCNFGRNEVYDAVGLPVRSDVQIDLLAVQQVNRNDQSLNSGLDRSTQISGVGGFVDLVWDPVITGTNPFIMGQQMQSVHQKYVPRFVITSLDPIRLLTIPAQLLALASTSALQENNAWIAAFRPKALLGKATDMHDIGAVGFEANLDNNPTGIGSRVNTRGESFRPEMLGVLVTTTIKPGLIMSMDIPEVGASTHYNGVFSAATTSIEAQRAIIEAANVLTNGTFKNYFQMNTGRVLIDDQNRIHMGYYIDQDGIKRDIRDIDYLAVANMVGEKDPAMIREWSDTFLRTEYPMELRLAERKRTIVGLTKDPVFTGFARRVTFSREFIDALVKACIASGLIIRTMGNYMDSGTFERATGSFLNQALMSGGVTGMFDRNIGFGNNVGNGPSNFNRWG